MAWAIQIKLASDATDAAAGPQVCRCIEVRHSRYAEIARRRVNLWHRKTPIDQADAGVRSFIKIASLSTAGHHKFWLKATLKHYAPSLGGNTT